MRRASTNTIKFGNFCVKCIFALALIISGSIKNKNMQI